jgi:photosystem II stability/assembly factor-like uncharacterized protein
MPDDDPGRRNGKSVNGQVFWNSSTNECERKKAVRLSELPVYSQQVCIHPVIACRNFMGAKEVVSMRPAQVLFVSFCAVVLCTPAAAQEKTMRLLAPATGWALGNGRLFWTTDNGEHWTNITPERPGAKIADVLFRDVVNGWVVLESSSEHDMIRVEIATTSDGGSSWIFVPLPVPKQFPAEFSGAAWVDFVDGDHGWVLLRNHTSSAFSSGRLFQTQDGGNTWRELPQTPLGVPPVFISPTDGFLAGDSGTGGSGNMYRTHDGGQTWEGDDLKEPSSSSGIVNIAYGELRFADSKHGSVVVTYSPLSGQSTLVLFTTSDGGLTWSPGRTLRVPNMYGESPLPSTVVDSALIVLRDARLTTVGPDSAHATIGIGGVSPHEVFTEISFMSERSGWLRTSDGKLLSTTDGGKTLTWLVPGSAPGALPPPRRITSHVQAGVIHGPSLIASAAGAASPVAAPAPGDEPDRGLDHADRGNRQ